MPPVNQVVELDKETDITKLQAMRGELFVTRERMTAGINETNQKINMVSERINQIQAAAKPLPPKAPAEPTAPTDDQPANDNDKPAEPAAPADPTNIPVQDADMLDDSPAE